MRFVLCFLLLNAILVAGADSFQLLRSNPKGYAEVQPISKTSPLNFPRAHQPHEKFRMEWWYLTANLQDSEGKPYGVHWTLFRQSMNAKLNPGGWSSNQVWMAHAALTTEQGHVYEERFARGGIGQAGVSKQGNFEAWLDDWVWRSESASPLPGELTFTVGQKLVKLSLSASTPWVLQGDAGYSQKSALGQASYYYSQPHIEITGSVTSNGHTTNLKGKGWLDREWSSQPLAPSQPGWDWLSIHLDDGRALMVYRLRQSDGDHWYSGSWISSDGSSQTLGKDDLIFKEMAFTEIQTSAKNVTRRLPLHWQVSLPKEGLSWKVTPLSKDHWLNTTFPYWEGPVSVSGSSQGVGYLELTGY